MTRWRATLSTPLSPLSRPPFSAQSRSNLHGVAAQRGDQAAREKQKENPCANLAAAPPPSPAPGAAAARRRKHLRSDDGGGGPNEGGRRRGRTLRKPASKPSRKVERAEVASKDGKKSPNSAVDSPPMSPSLSAPSISRRQELLLQSNLSLNASCSSDCSSDSYCSRSSTGRIGGPRLTSRRKHVLPKPEKIVAKLEKLVPDDTSKPSPEDFYGKRRCAWVTPNIGHLWIYLRPFSRLNSTGTESTPSDNS